MTIERVSTDDLPETFHVTDEQLRAVSNRTRQVVRTRKVRGVTERYYAMAAQSIVLPDPGEGGPDVLMRHAVADLEAAPADGERHVRMAHLRLTDEQFAELGARLQALADEYRRLSDPSLPDVSLAFALFRPAQPEQARGEAK
jgi:hypothetical protein